MSDPEGMPGAAPPEARLAVTPRDWRDLGSALRSRAGARPPFPLGRPSWPGSVPRPPAEKRLGIAYDTDWARSQAARAARAVVRDLLAGPVLRALASPEVRGLDRIAHLDEPAIFAANHASHLDAPLIVSVVPSRWKEELFVAGAADYFFDTRLKAAAFAFLLNAVPIERQRVSRDSARLIASLLRDGWSMLIFPEGGRSPDGWGQHHQRGPAWLAARTGLPVVPVHVEGTRQILAKGSRRIRPGRTVVSFGSPLRPGPGGDRALAAAVEAAIALLADELASDWYSARRRAAAGATPPLTGPDAAPWRRAWALGRPSGRPREHWPR